MQPEAAERQDTGISAEELASLLQWWQISGADTAVSEEATNWFESTNTESEDISPASNIVPLQTLRPHAQSASNGSRPLVSANNENWSEFDNLGDFCTHVLSLNRRAPLFDGNPQSGLMILGEAPSAQDLRTGRPFTGPAGQFLDLMLAAIGLNREQAYISLLAPRMDKPGPPSDADVEADLEMTRAHIRLVNPRHILLVGAIPVRWLTGNETPITRIRGQWLEVPNGEHPIPALPTFNPAYLLRRPEEKAKAWADLLQLKKRLSA